MRHDVHTVTQGSQPGMTALKPYPAYKDSGMEWLGEVPEHWQVRRLKNICRLNYGDSLGSNMRSDGEVAIFGSNGQIGWHDVANAEAPCIVVGRKGSFGKVNYVADPVFAIDTTFFVDRRSSTADIRWLYYGLVWLRLDEVTKDSAIPGLDRQDAYARRLVMPPRSEQTGIARFLAHVDRCIQRYIRTKERLIELLEEQKQAIIQEAVTGLIDVRTGQPYPAYKDSGVEWLGRIPEHWTVRRNKWLFTERNETGFGFLPVLSVSLHQGVRVRDMETGGRKQQISERDRYQRAKKGDMAYNMMRMWQGAVGVVPADGLVSPAYVVMSPVDDVKSPYYEYLFRTDAYKEIVRRFSKGIVSDRDRLYWDAFKRIASVVPPTGEQAGIARFLERADRRTSARRATVQREIDLLREYHRRLIADIVTGKLDVREAAAQLPELDPTKVAGRVDATQPESKARATDYGVGKETDA